LYKCCYNYRVDSDRVESAGFRDPTQQSAWRPLRLLQAAMDAEIARIYAEAQIDRLKPSWVMELLRLHARGPMTITELASSVQLTHSAVSQKVAAMRTAGWVRTSAGPDARSKKVHLTAKATRIIGLLAAEWRATEAAVAELEAEIPYPLSRVVTDIEEALRRRSFHDRILEKLAQDPDWSASQAGAPMSGVTAGQAGVTAG
jgi:DNA-binding MarR family transcriptional regulator